MYKNSQKKICTKSSKKRCRPDKQGRPRLDSVFISGHDKVFASGSYGFVSGGERRTKKKEPAMLGPWPGEETIMFTDKERSMLTKANRKLKPEAGGK